MAICKSCGAKLKPNEKFCLECGSAVDEIVTAEEPEAVSSAAPATPAAPASTPSANINIVKPKDISVLKKNIPAPPQKTAPKTAPVSAVQTSKSETDSPAPAASFKREIPDIELPEDNRYFAPTIVEGAPPPVAHSMQSKRDDDFAKDFYSDSSVTKKNAGKAAAAIAYENRINKEKQNSNPQKDPPKPITVFVVVLLIAAAAYFLYQSGILANYLPI